MNFKESGYSVKTLQPKIIFKSYYNASKNVLVECKYNKVNVSPVTCDNCSDIDRERSFTVSVSQEVSDVSDGGGTGVAAGESEGESPFWSLT